MVYAKKTLLLSAVLILLTATNVLASQTAESIELTIPAGGWDTETFVIFDDDPSETPCELILTGSLEDVVFNLPEELNLSNSTTQVIKPLIAIPESPASSYNGDIWYCKANIDVDITVSGTIIEEKPCVDDIQVNWYGSKRPGSKLLFYVFNTTDKKGITAFITVKSLETGNPEQELECDGYCEPRYDIAPNEQGQIVAEVDIPGCGSKAPIPIDISGEVVSNDSYEGSTGEALTITTGKNEVSLGETWQVLVTTSRGPEQWVNVQIIGTGYTWEGTTNEYGVALDSQNKVFGKDIKIGETGVFQIFAKKEGYKTDQKTISIVRKDCPYECCPEGEYTSKGCQAGFECKENKCSEIAKPAMKVECTPEPYQFDKISCQIRDTANNLIPGNIPATMKKGSLEESIVFIDGIYELDRGFAETGTFQVTVPETIDYATATTSGTIIALQIPWTDILIVIVAIAAVLIGVIVLLRKRRGRGSGDYMLETPAVEVEKVSYEK